MHFIQGTVSQEEYKLKYTSGITQTRFGDKIHSRLPLRIRVPGDTDINAKAARNRLG
jgi:hypothetical protein